MNHLFSHPATVHIPLALGVLLPFAYPLILWGIKRKKLPEGFLWVFTTLAVLVLVSGGFAFLSGESAKALSAADAELLTRHEATAQWFCLVWLLIVGLSGLSSLNPRFRHWTLNFLLGLILFGQVLLTFQLGQLGGKIVFGG